MRPVVSAVRFRTFWVGLFGLLAVWLAITGAVLAADKAQGDPDVYDGKAIWDSSYSWNAELSKDRVWRIYEGKPSLKVRFQRDWAGVSFGSKGLDLKDYTHLRFAMHSGGLGIPSLQVGLHDQDGQLIKLVPAILYATLGERGWFTVSIPLKDLHAEGKTVTRVTIQQRHGATTGPFHLAAIRFVKDERAKKHREEPKKDETFTEYVFDDKVRWMDRSWDTQMAVHKPHPVYAGSSSLAVTFTEPWAGLSFRTDGFISGFQTLRFVMHGRGGATPTLRAILYDQNGEIGRVRVTRYIKDIENGWYVVAIPLADFGATEKEITRVTLQEGRGIVPQTFYVDELRFTWP